jgi:hypothetical protein
MTTTKRGVYLTIRLGPSRIKTPAEVVHIIIIIRRRRLEVLSGKCHGLKTPPRLIPGLPAWTSPGSRQYLELGR